MITELLTLPAPNRLDFASKAEYEAAWRDWRRTGIGGSDAGKIAGVTPKTYGSVLGVQWDKLGYSDSQSPGIQMRRGNALEPLIGELWQERYEEEFADSQVLVRHPDYPFMIGSIDWTRKNGRLVEGKTINADVARRYGLGPDGDSDSLMPWWEIQASHYMACYGTDLVTFAVFILGSDDFRCYDLYRDEEVIRSLIELLGPWWEKHVLAQVPVRDYASSDADLIARRYRGETGDQLVIESNHLLQSALAYDSLGETISELNRQVKEAKELRDAEKAAVLDAMGDSTILNLPMGYQVNRKVIRKKQYTVKATSYPQIDVQSNLFRRSIT